MSLRRLRPRTGYWLDAADNLPWLEKSIAAGAVTRPEKALGYGVKTFEIISSVAGTVIVMFDLVGDGDFKDFVSKSVPANTPTIFSVTETCAYVRLRFDTATTITAKFNFDIPYI
jgi:hypothetical protein